jgi:hypothetical protein
MMSVALPAVKGTTTETRLLGHDCAPAGFDTITFEAINAAQAASQIDICLIVVPILRRPSWRAPHHDYGPLAPHRTTRNMIFSL